MTNPTPHGQVPEALRLAEEITNLECSSEAAAKTIAAAADELCRLHVENASLRASPAASPTPPAEQQAQPDECFPGEPKVAVPQGLISAACFVIRNKSGGGKVLEQLRRYSAGDRSQPLAPQQAAPKAAPAPLSEREAFEAWIKKDGGDLGTFGTPPNMHYRNSAVNNALSIKGGQHGTE